MFKKIKTICTIKHLNILAKELVNKAKIGDVFLLKGELGVGKTTLARFLINEFYRKHSLKIPKSIKSPSFPILLTYDLNNFEIYHYDLYRVSKSSELIHLNIFEELNNSITLVEWPETILDSLKNYNYYSINFDIVDENTRTLKHNLIFN